MNKQAQVAVSASASNEAHHEPPGVNVRGTLLSAVVVGGMVLVSCIAASEVYRILLLPTSERSPTPLYGEGLILPAKPQLEGIEMMSAANAAAVVSTNDDRVNRYGWVD